MSLFAASVLPAQDKSAAERVKLGIDVFALRSQGFGPFEFLDYAARKRLRVVHLSEIRFIGGLEETHLRKLKAYADRLGVEIEVGMMSLCPSSKRFDASAGTAEEQVARMARAARTVGAQFFRAVVGSLDDRKLPGGIERHIENTVAVLRRSRTLLLDLGIKAAIENHAGDLQARELKQLVEAAGTDIAGVCLDSANPLWALEDPHLTLETLHPYVLTSSVRDSAVWLTPEGYAVAWTRMGEGTVDIASWIRSYARLCPGRALSIETIVTGPRVFAFERPGFWTGYENVRAAEFHRLLKLAARGSARSAPSKLSAEQARRRELEDFEVSLDYVKGIL
jgi:sugar phosphate isomerase/epimerase